MVTAPAAGTSANPSSRSVLGLVTPVTANEPPITTMPPIQAIVGDDLAGSPTSTSRATVPNNRPR